MFHTQVTEKSVKYWTIISKIFKIPRLKLSNQSVLLSSYCTQSSTHKQEKIEDLFIKPEVQKILKKVTAADYDKVFAISKVPLEPHKYEFVTDKRLKELQEIAAAKASKKLQMPPVMSIREPIDKIFAKDPELQGYLKHTVIFTDISPNTSSRDRVITVRETDGTLRKANWEERGRMNQIFYPIPGRHLDTPKLFESPFLDRLLDEGSYKFVLDSACTQFEPDDPEYHRVTNITYDHIKSMKKFDDLRSTRHFGPMAFYYAYTKTIDPLLVDMIERQLISDACDTIKLLYLMHEEMQFSKNVDKSNENSVIEDYIVNYASQKTDLEAAVQTFLEQNSGVDKEISV